MKLKRGTEIVTLKDTRSGNGGAGVPDKCFYCTAKIHAPHDIGCVCRMRHVVMKATITYVAEEPADWDSDLIEFARNESSWCANNLLTHLEKHYYCICSSTKIEYLKEAEESDLVGYEEQP